MNFIVTKPVAALGVKVVYCVIRGVDNTSENTAQKGEREAKLQMLAQQYAELD